MNGKQLVFLFMAAAVVSVVIFLCGVLVGRGVRAQVNPSSDAAAFGTAPAAALPAGEASATPDVPADAPLQSSAGAAASPSLTYYDRLDAKSPVPETLKPAATSAPVDHAAPAVHPEKSTAPAARSTTATTPKPEDAAFPPPAGSGYAVQVAALRDEHEADAVARRLLGKGYHAYVVVPAGGRPAVFRVRVGKFKTRAQAQAVATRLRKEEQFKPWITR